MMARVTEQIRIEAEQAPRRIGRPAADALAFAVAFCAYLAVFAATREGSLADHLAASLRNVGSLAILAMGVRAIVERVIAARGFVRQAASHAGLAVVFTVGWYWLVTVLGGFFEGRSPFEFSVAPFLLGPALSWQLLQGLSVYATVAALSHLGARQPEPEIRVSPSGPTQEGVSEREAAEPPRIALQRYFVRVGEDIIPIDAAAIVSIAGADDYAQVTTETGSHLARMTLADFEASLDPDTFLRVHRSRIVNLACIVRAEPAGGGRLLLHMSAGESVPSSRAGAKLLRDRVV